MEITSKSFTSFGARSPLGVAAQKSRELASELVNGLDLVSVEELAGGVIAEAEASRPAKSGAAGSARGASAAPQLRVPDAGILRQGGSAADASTQYSGAALLTLVMGTLAKAVERFELDRVLASAQAYLASLAAHEAAAGKVTEAYGQALRELEDAMDVAEGCAKNAEDALGAVDAARREVDTLQKALEGMSSDDPAYAALKSKLDGAAANLGQKEQAAQQAMKASDAAVAVVSDKVAAVKETKQSAGELGATRPDASSRADSQRSRMFELMARLQQVLADAKESELQSTAETSIKMMKANEKEMGRIADERAEQMEKAAAAQKKMGCIGKIVGWVITAVSVIAAPFTGGVSMALAAVGLAMAITEEVTGFSVLGAVMDPIVKGLQSLVGELTKAFGDVLSALGVAGADKIAEVLAYIATAVLVVAVMVVGVVAVKGAMAKLLPAIMKQISKNVATEGSKIVAKESGKAAAKTAARQAANASRAAWAGKASAGAQIAGGLNQASQGVGNIVVADMRVSAAEKLAKQLRLAFDLHRLHEFSDAQYRRIADLEESIGKAVQSISATETNRAAAARAVISNLAATSA